MDAIKAKSGCDVIPSDKNNPDDKQLLEDLVVAAEIETKNANERRFWREEKVRLGIISKPKSNQSHCG